MSCGKLFSGVVLRIALPVPTRDIFDYLPDSKSNINDLKPGVRFLVPFGKRKLVGVLVEITSGSELPANKLKKVIEALDKEPLFSTDIMQLLKWASDYYHHPLGDVMVGALPVLLRTHCSVTPNLTVIWSLTDAGRDIDVDAMQRAPRQAELLGLLAAHPQGISEQAIGASQTNWRATIRSLQHKGWVTSTRTIQPRVGSPSVPANSGAQPVNLNADQQAAMQSIVNAFGRFCAFVLEGITGSGKTEVYLEAINAVINRGQQALVLVPEINLTPQLTQRFQARFSKPLAVLHSQLTDKQRLDAWLAAREGEVDIVIGTRSAVTTPFPNLGLIIVDEEHDSSLKQQEGFRYSARDLAVMRARKLAIPVVLGSATPSFESLHNVDMGRYQKLQLKNRFGNARLPSMQLLDMRRQPLFEGLSLQLLETMRQHLARGHQVLLFINRRGYAPTLLCHDCGWIARCQRCDSHMTYHHGKQKLRCHHCGAERRAEQSCPDCNSETLIPLGEGTERVAQALQNKFPDIGVIRIDRDTTRRKGSLENLLNEIHQGAAKILVGTQMLAKGHHFPDVTLVGILNVDQGLFSVDFHALEKTAQLIIQVAGRAGRSDKPGSVLIQTHHPEHPLLQTLLSSGYDAFARQALQERQQANLPPFSFMAILRAEAVAAGQPMQFLQQAKELAQTWMAAGVELLGPLPSPMEKRAGRYRAQLFIQAPERAALHQLLTPWVLALENSTLGRKVRWSIDVDPVDVY